jgi:tRNA(fMet)-specific endonuclease VapC
MAVLIDTSIVIAYERRRSTLDDLVSLAGNDAALASITASEILTGLYRSLHAGMRPQRESFLEEIIAQFPVLPFNLQIARVHAHLTADLAAVGQTIGTNDSIIAATALAHDREVMTHNVRHFRRVPGLVVREVAD